MARGLALLLRSPGLWVFVAAPLALTAITLGGAVFGVGSWLMGWIREWLQPDSGWFSGLLYWIAAAGVYALSFVGAYLAFTSLRQMFAAPFNDRLSLKAEKVQRELDAHRGRAPVRGAAAGEGAVRGTARALWSTSRLLAAEYSKYLLCLPLLLIPVVGVVAFWLVRSYYAGLNALDVILACHGFTHGQKKAIFRAARRRLIGLGSGVVLLDMTVVLSLVAAQVGAIGGTLLYLDLERKGLPGSDDAAPPLRPKG